MKPIDKWSRTELRQALRALKKAKTRLAKNTKELGSKYGYICHAINPGGWPCTDSEGQLLARELVMHAIRPFTVYDLWLARHWKRAFTKNRALKERHRFIDYLIGELTKRLA